MILAQSEVVPAGNGSIAWTVVLWRREHALHPYVVHYQAVESGSRWTGSYCTNIVEAANAFRERCKKWNIKDSVTSEFDNGR